MPLNFKHINASEQLVDGSISTSLLADGSVTAAKLAIGAITSSSIIVDSDLDFNNFEALNFRVENVTSLPLPGNPGRLIWNTTVNDLFVDVDTAIAITHVSNVSLFIITIVDTTNLVVSSTTGIIAGDIITQGVTSATVVTVTDATHLEVSSTVGFIGQSFASVNFGIVTVTDGTNLVIDDAVGMQPGDTITQGFASTTIVSITDSTHIVVVDTTGFSSGIAIVLVPFNVVTVTDATHLVVSNTTGMGVGDTITQGFASTTIVTVTDLTHLVVASTSGWVSNSAIDHTLTIASTTAPVVGLYVVQGGVSSLITDVIDLTHIVVTDSTGFIVGAALVGGFVSIMGDTGVTSIHADSSPNITGDIQLVSGTNIVLSQVGNAITINATSSGSLTPANFIVGEIPSGAIDGINMTFTLAFLPTVGTDEVYLNGVRLKRGALDDYTISGAVITTNAAPQIGDGLLVDYMK